MPDRKLIVIGDGPDLKKIQSKAGQNVTILGYQSFLVLKDYMQRAKAFVFAAEEDFGIIPVEAQACGTPVIAYGKGGTLETIRGMSDPKPTGVFFEQQSIDSLSKAVSFFENNIARFVPQTCRENSLRFSTERFREEMRDYVNEQIACFRK